MSRLGIFAAAFLATLGALSACTQDFNQFEPKDSVGTGGATTGSSTSSSGASSSSTSSSSTSSSSSSSSGSMMCTMDAQCDDNNTCTNDKCATGLCQHLDVADGPDAKKQALPTDCFDWTCKAGVETKVNNDAKVPDDSNPCTVDVCQSGTATHTPEPATKSCGPNQFCDGNGKCVGCNSPAQCPAPPTCQVATCSAMTCGTSPAPSGDSCGGTKKCDGNGACVACLADPDCGGLPQICVANACINSCGDNKKDGNESATDCGGACAKCANGKTCNGNADCTSNNCSGGTCAPAAPTCFDSIKNGTETDVDCGGSCAAKCADGLKCLIAADCQSGDCASLVCAAPAPTCNDNIKNGAETDIDCGGGTCPACADTKACKLGTDCVSVVCQGLICRPATCGNTMKDGSETDVDCGGGTCGKCVSGKACLVNSDCFSFCKGNFTCN